ncbi:MAG: LuxR family transcriptional regulator [Rhodopseudomonas palustris]|mgnify:CR=1 FL=1|nr:MAG: LuxR family transcriptional regulator [Rhodopseudomonas palustris]
MSRRELDETLNVIGAVDRAKGPDEIAKCLLSVVRPYGFSRVLAGTIPLRGASSRQQLSGVVLKCWPQQWSDRYFTEGYLFEDPAVHRLTSSVQPFAWSELAIEGEGQAKRIMGEASDFGLRSGFTVSMVTLDGQSAGLSIAGDTAQLPPALRGAVQMMANYAFAKALIVREQSNRQVRLTPRESDVLHWIAEGKTDWEIGKILNVSQHLVDKVARQLRAKLGATNRIQMITVAMRSGLVR